MSCPKKNSLFSEKPKRTKAMKMKNMDYVWKEVAGNPNLYCWIPISKKYINILDIDPTEVSIQDIPPPVIPENFDDIIAVIAEEAIHSKQKSSLDRLKHNREAKNLVSVDDPNKYPIVKDFIKRKGLKIYGGVAINSFLPKKDKFYQPTDIPDYDFFSPNPWDDAVELADEFYKKGYEFTEAKAGIHKGTYKVYANFWPVADITYVNQKDFDKIKTKTIDGVKIVGPFKLLESMYKEFSEPYVNPSRWPKVASREKLLQKWTNPLNKKFKCSKTLFSGGIENVNPILVNLLEITYNFIKEKNLLITGSLAYNTYIEVGGGSKRLLIDRYSVLSETANKDIEELFTLLMKNYPCVEAKDCLETTTIYYSSRELNNTVYNILAKINGVLVPVCEIIHMTNCTPYHRVLEHNIVSIDYLKYELYDIAVFGDTPEIVENTKCKLQYITQIQERFYKDKKMLETDKGPFQRFIIKCKGPFQENIKIEVLNRYFDRIVQKSKILKENTSSHKVLRIPHEEISENCRGISKEDCKYPCAWNKYIGLCSGIPARPYRSEDNENGEDSKLV